MKNRFCLIFIIFFLAVGSAVAQDGFPEFPPDDDDASVPVDGGISFLIAGGVALGAGKLYKKRSKKEVKEELI